VTPTRIALTVLCALTIATALTPPSPARAADQDRRIRVYKVTAEGTGAFQYDLSLPLGDGLGSETKRNVSFGWHIELPSVAFLANGEGVPVGVSGPAQGSTITGEATEETTVVGSDGKGGNITTHGYCEAKDGSQFPSGSVIKPDPFSVNGDSGGANITVQPFQEIAFPANCTAKIYNGRSVLSVDVSPTQFEQRFFLPTEATRQGKIIQLVDASPTQKDQCPPTLPFGNCAFDWHGTLTFEFTGYLGEGELTPDDLVVPLPSGGSLSRRGDSASIEVTCPVACNGVVRAYPAPRAARAATAAAKPLAKAHFSAPANKAVKVRLRFRGTAARKLRKARAVRLVVDTGSARKSVLVRAR
jgi:hypothetical protein